MAREYINGRLFINGYATDELGRPRTVTNGYTDEDERDAIEEYEEAKQSLKKENNQQKTQNETPKKQNQTTDKTKNDKKFKEKKDLQFCRVPNSLRGKKFCVVNGEIWDVEYIDNHYYVGGYATNEMGQPICSETGYDDESVLQSINMYKNAKATQYYNL